MFTVPTWMKLGNTVLVRDKRLQERYLEKLRFTRIFQDKGVVEFDCWVGSQWMTLDDFTSNYDFICELNEGATS